MILDGSFPISGFCRKYGSSFPVREYFQDACPRKHIEGWGADSALPGRIIRSLAQDRQIALVGVDPAPLTARDLLYDLEVLQDP